MKTAKKPSVLEKIKAEQERIKKKKESSGGYEKIDWYKAEEGDNLVRILPATTADGLPFKTVHLHYISVKKRDGSIAKGIPVRCFEDFEEECPLCAATRELYDGDEKDKEKAKELRAREVYLYNLINFKDRKVQPYAAGITVHEEILQYTADVGMEVFDVDSGHNWKITKKVDPRKPKNLGIKYSVRMDIKESAVPPKLKVLLEEVTDLDSLYTGKDVAAINAYLENIGMDEHMIEEAGEEEAPKSKKSASKKAVAEEDDDDFEEVKPTKKKASKVVEEEEEEFEEEEEEVKPAKKAAKKTSKVVEEDEDEEEEEYEEVKPKKKAAKKVVEEEEEEEFEEEEEDDDFEAELRELGM